ncbi:S9 family peptidase [Indioceanicola profundi]|uniref:S9 family peptidase n=1 Tax=Indioceanicola profundi TaxID=2220096 RepID=UPI001CEDE5F6|nr:S9 family peptidase [Indioceanicola profundi]
MKALTLATFAAAVALLPAALPASAATTAPEVKAELIPRQELFGNPSRSAPRISPDGKMLAFLAPRDGVMNVFVAPLGQMDEAKPITQEKVRPVRQYSWALDSSQILYVQDKGGTEDFLLYGVDIVEGKTREYTPFENTRVQLVGISPAVNDAILVGLNNRDPRWHDVHRLNLKTGELTLVRENDGYAGFVADHDLNLRLALKPRPDGGMVVERIEADGKTAPLTEIGPDDALSTNILGIPKGADYAYAVDTRGRDKAALMRLDLKTGETTKLAESDQADIGGIMDDPVTGEVQAYNVEYLTDRWVPLGDALKADIEFLDREAKGQWAVTSRDLEDDTWTVVIDRVTEPAAYWLYDREARKLDKLFTIRPELEDDTLAPMYAREIKSRDGKTLVSYLSLPPGTDPDGDGVPDRPVPMVLNVHGGPWARDSFGYNSEHQWLANRGYAVLSVNFRSSTGFGKEFTNAGDKAWGREMHDDLIDAVDWAIAQKITAKDTVAIYGGSYGGYATLWGVTNTPERFACGVDIVGPSNLATLLNSVPAYWASFFEQLARRVGDPRTEEGKALLAERSPLTYVDKIQTPLLIAQGTNDPRVKQAESDQIVEAMKANKIPVTYVLYPDEGHGFAVPENRISFYAVAEGFLSHCLGGRYEPVGDDFQGASLQVPEGADYVPGLKEALAAKK